MTDERWQFLMSDAAWEKCEPLTEDEKKAGWHFCLEFDGLLRQPVDIEDAGKRTAFKCNCLDHVTFI